MRNYIQVVRVAGIIACGLVILAALYITHETGLQRDGIMPLIAIVGSMAALILVVSYRVFMINGNYIELYEQGFRISHGDQSKTVYWTDVEGVTLNDTSMMITQGIIPVYYLAYYYLTLYKDGKKLFVLTLEYHRYREMGLYILNQTQQVLVKKSLAALKRGNEVKAGGITFSLSGIQKGKKRVEWADVADYSPNTGSFSVKTRAGKTVRFRYNQEKDQNFHILHDLIAAQLYGQPRMI